MLKNVDPLLSPDILHALCSMGHGDEVVIVDAHYPALTAAKGSTLGKVLRMDGGDTAKAIRTVLSVMPLDGFVDTPAERMMVDNEPDILPHVQREALTAVQAAEGSAQRFGVIPRRDFYQRAKNSHCVIITGETRGWGCFILKKGLIVTADSPSDGLSAHLADYFHSLATV